MREDLIMVRMCERLLSHVVLEANDCMKSQMAAKYQTVARMQEARESVFVLVASCPSMLFSIPGLRSYLAAFCHGPKSANQS